MPLLQRFHYDIAQVSNPAAMAALTKLVATSQILFGTDFPFRNAADQIDGSQNFSPPMIRAKSARRTRGRYCRVSNRFER